MPWKIDPNNPDCSGFAVVAENDGKVMGCHKTEEEAKAQLAALYANEPEAKSAEPEVEVRARPPRDGIRAMPPGETASDGKHLHGRLARAGEWAVIDSVREGRFLERWTAGATRKSFTENRGKIRILFQHGKDPQLGNKPIAVPTVLDEDREGPYYDGELLDGLPPLVVDGLRKGQYGTSHAFSSVREDWEPRPKGGAHNPERLPERTIREAAIHEISVVTWPAYAGASASLRSMTDEFGLAALAAEPERLRDVVTYIEPVAPSPTPGPSPTSEERRETPAEPPPPRAAPEPEGPPTGGSSHVKEPTVPEYTSIDELRARDREITDELTRMAGEYLGVMPDDPQARWNSLTAEQDKVRADIAAYETRMARLETITKVWPPTGGVPGTPPVVNIIRRPSEGDIYDGRWAHESSVERRDQVLRDDAMRAAEIATYVPGVDKADAAGQLAHLLDHRDSANKELARRVLATGSPLYRRAFNKYITGQYMTPEEQRGTALAVQVDATGGFLLPFAFDPSIIRIGAHATNPYRAVCRVEKIVGTDTWLGLTSTAVVATRADEAAAATEQGPTFAQPSILVTKVQGAITYSIETGEDRADLGAEMAGLIAEAKDNEEETEFSVGDGTAIGQKFEPIGFFAAHGTSGMYTHIDLAAAHTWAIGDVDNVEAALPIRHRTNAVWFMHRKTLRTIQGLETTGGRLFGGTQYPAVGVTESKGSGYTGLRLLGYPVYEAPSATYDVTVDDTPLAWLGDPRSYCIVDRVGINVEYIPHVFADAAGSLPTGQRRLYFYYRNSGKPINTDAGRLLFVLNA